MNEITIRELTSLGEARAASELFDRIWGKARVVSHELLLAMATHGGEVLGAFREGELVGAQMGFLGLLEGRPVLHSHVTGVAPDVQHRGVGLLLKRAQRDWCLDRDIDTVTWTFDPLVARNAYFNLRKLGVIADRLHRDFYGPMTDALNAGDRSDRLEARWELRAPRVVAALAGERPLPDPAGAAILLDEAEGRPVPGEPGGERMVVRVPPDYAALRGTDPPGARAWRDAVADALEAAFAAGYQAVDFLREGGYVVERR